ncbi:MAG: hypothetical protein EAY75_15465, partial [Bacteroidetes bacterium]
DDVVWQMMNDWLAQLPETEFTAVVPLLRRTFSAYSAAEKRKIAERAVGGTAPKLSTAHADTAEMNPEWGLAAIFTFKQIITGQYNTEIP